MADDRTLQKRYEEFDRRPDELVGDAVIGHQFYKSTMRECPHPAVRKRHTTILGQCFVSTWTCKRCRHAITFPYHGGVACGYEQKT